MIKTVLNFLFPQKCLGCRKEHEILCPKCLKEIRRPSLPEDKGIFAAADYGDEVVKKAIWLFKYKGAKQLAEPLAELLKERVWPKIKSKINPEKALVIPVPLSGKRRRQRGFNQAELLAHFLAESVCAGALYKKTHTVSQVSVKEKEKRLDNLKDSFGVKNAELVKNKTIILIDDVCTTGATIKEAKRTLKEAGAKNVLAVVVARG